MTIFDIEWLLDQLPVVVVMGVWISTLYYDRRQNIKEKEKEKEELKKERKEAQELLDEKNKQLYALAEKVLAVASLWDAKSDLNTKEHKDIITLLNSIRDDVREIKMKHNV